MDCVLGGRNIRVSGWECIFLGKSLALDWTVDGWIVQLLCGEADDDGVERVE